MSCFTNAIADTHHQRTIAKFRSGIRFTDNTICTWIVCCFSVGHGEDEEGTGSNLRLKPVNLIVKDVHYRVG
ncbi:hypothetical protein L2E82_40164 [Cichorium intybus]|uniref:Uncharacterized protein n=1 Tax=Cichorium intybus TaxID=13427 RepID=A0ACB9AJH7_CICIN|nr:hypothetical protein L2E82_40164 [Cichorium intybus]